MDFEFGLDIDHVRAFSNSGTLVDYSTSGLHTHPYDQVLLIRNGISVFEYGRLTVPQYGNTAAFIPAGLPHRSKTLGSEIEYQSLYLHRSFFNCHHEGIRLFRFSELSRALLDRLCQKNLVSLTHGTEGECLSLIIRTAEEDFKNIDNFITLPIPSRAENRTVTDYIHEKYSEQISMRNISSQLPYTERHIARIFFEDMHITVINYLRMYRIFRASVEIQTTRKPVTDIAYQCGYESISSFYRDFHAFFGIAPKSFRKHTSGS
jgi:AraC-like DNA-binding protein